MVTLSSSYIGKLNSDQFLVDDTMLTEIKRNIVTEHIHELYKTRKTKTSVWEMNQKSHENTKLESDMSFCEENN